MVDRSLSLTGAQYLSRWRFLLGARKLRNKANEVAPVGQKFIIDRLMVGGLGGPLDLKDRRTNFYVQSFSHGLEAVTASNS